ncbi:Cysteine protease atg4 [Aspergillus nanangensis]|uniref:Cysteine protease n=1 Tax=Aspergillus nanangensis TaxID=2582783 RepID=A0AAD4CIC9_ASPNN|nr:Cysteine protease atg4 [Aspergillus nanangensis]
MNSVDIGRCSKRIVQYLWDPEPRNDEEPHESIWCLGVEYPTNQRSTAALETTNSKSNPSMPLLLIHKLLHEGFVNSQSEVDEVTADEPSAESRSRAPQQETLHGWPDDFLLDFESRIWMTYRSNFPPIPKLGDRDANNMTLSVRLRSQLMDPEGFTSDTGWGCMIRSGQCLLANAMSSLLLGRDWRRGKDTTEETRLLSLFADHKDAPLSIHRFVKHGAECCGKHPGEWFGPSATARCIEALSSQYGNPTLRVYVSNDSSDVYQDKFMNVARDESGSIQPTLILLGTRLGIDHITPVYWDSLKATLRFPQSVGIAGGRPSASHYFVGVQGSFFFYLDPHNTRSALPPRPTGDPYSKDDVDSYHTRRLRRIHIKDMDPSMLIGILIKDEADWWDWKKRVGTTDGKPIIHVLNEMQRSPQGREEALDEVEALDDAE